MKWIAITVLLLSIFSSSLGHSWCGNPAARFPSPSSYCITKDDGTPLSPAICAKDAQATDMIVLRPTTWPSKPCYFNSGHTYNDAPTSVVQTNSVLCVTWPQNAHSTDETRNIDGGVRISLSSVVNNPTQADFDKSTHLKQNKSDHPVVVLANIPFEKFMGAKVKIPNVPAGDYVLEWFWHWPTSTGTVDRLFISCSDIAIVNPGDPRLATQQSPTYGMGLPYYFSPESGWSCNPGDIVYTNTSLVTSSGSGGTTGVPATTGPRTTGTTGTTGPRTTGTTGTTGPRTTGTTGTTGVRTTTGVVSGTTGVAPGTTGPRTTGTTGTTGVVGTGSTTGSITAGSPDGKWCYQESSTDGSACPGGGAGSATFSPNLLTLTYIKPSNSKYGSLWQVKHGSLAAYNVTIPSGCWNWNPSILLLQFYSRADTTCTSGSYGSCFDGNNWVKLTVSTSGACGTSTGSTNTGSTVTDGDWNTYGYYVGDIGSAWTFTNANPGDTSGQARIYEEAMWWSISNTPGSLVPEGQTSGGQSGDTGSIGDNQVGDKTADSSSSNVGPIVGGIIAAVAVVAALAVGAFFWKRRAAAGTGGSKL